MTNFKGYAKKRSWPI